MHDHFPPGAGRSRTSCWTQETLAEKAIIALTALKRLESESYKAVNENTRHQVMKALEAAGIVFLDSDRGQGVLLVTNSSREQLQ